MRFGMYMRFGDQPERRVTDVDEPEDVPDALREMADELEQRQQRAPRDRQVQARRNR